MFSRILRYRNISIFLVLFGFASLSLYIVSNRIFREMHQVSIVVDLDDLYQSGTYNEVNKSLNSVENIKFFLRLLQTPDIRSAEKTLFWFFAEKANIFNIKPVRNSEAAEVSVYLPLSVSRKRVLGSLRILFSKVVKEVGEEKVNKLPINISQVSGLVNMKRRLINKYTDGNSNSVDYLNRAIYDSDIALDFIVSKKNHTYEEFRRDSLGYIKMKEKITLSQVGIDSDEQLNSPKLHLLSFLSDTGLQSDKVGFDSRLMFKTPFIWLVIFVVTAFILIGRVWLNEEKQELRDIS